MTRRLVHLALLAALAACGKTGTTPPCAGGSVECAGTCVNLASDGMNCGACGTACAAGQACAAGACVLSCQAGLTSCAGACTDTRTDRANCGACGSVCPSGQVCSSGTCALTCQAELTSCAGRCVDLGSDEANCGACGAACASGTACSAGTCVTSCPAGEVACGGRCVDPSSDPTFCGAGPDCSGGVTCGANAACAQGACYSLCPAGRLACGDACADPLTDPTHCGAFGACTGSSAGVACPAGETCADGACACVWTPVSSATLGTAPTGAVVRSGAAGQGPATVYGRTAWLQSADWNVLLVPHGLAAGDDVFAVEADVYVPAATSNYRYAAMAPFTTSGTAAGTLGVCQFMGGIYGALYERPGPSATVEWWNTSVCDWTRLASQPTESRAGAWHRLRVEGVRSTCRYRLLLDGTVLGTSTAACDPGGGYLSLFGGGLGQQGLVAWSNLAVYRGSSSASCIP